MPIHEIRWPGLGLVNTRRKQTLASYRAYLRSRLNGVRPKNGEQNLLVAHSMGALVALLESVENNHVWGIVYIAGVVPGWKFSWKALRTLMHWPYLKTLLRALFLRPCAFTIESADRDLFYNDTPHEERIPFGCESGRVLLGLAWEQVRPLPSGLHRPHLLVIAAREDRIIRRKSLEALAKWYGDKSTFVVAPGSHMLARREEQEAVVQYIDRWLTAHGKPKLGEAA